MRVYGASPLYNYVELVFRSKRLFIVSIVLATLIVSTLATLRAKSYTATAMILLSGTKQAMQAPDDAQMGSIRYKLNILNIVLKDPNFVKKAMHDYNDGVLQKNKNGAEMSEVEFDKFCKEARASLNYAAGENILEISCRWPNERAADIINAFFKAYKDDVLEQENATARLQEILLEKLLVDYTAREKNMEQKVVNYEKDNVERPLSDSNAAAQQYLNEMRSLEEQKLQISMLQEKKAEYARQLATTEKTIKEVTIGSSTADPDYQDAQKKRSIALDNLNELKKKYQDSHPKVKEAQAEYDAAVLSFTKAEAASKSHKRIDRQVEIPNPQYERLKALVDEQDAQLHAYMANFNLQMKLAEADKKKAQDAGAQNFSYKWLTNQYGLISQIRTNLQTRLENATLEAKRDYEMHNAEMTMLVPPEAEQEATGARSLMLYAAGPLLGIVIAFAFSLVAESLDHSLRTPVEVEKHLGKPVLAVLPRMDPPRASTRRQLGGGADTNRTSLPPA